MTRWKPDTCACVIDVLDWDAGIGTTVSTCPFHVGLVDAAHLAVVYMGENRVKNMALSDVALDAPQLFWTAEAARARNEAQVLAGLGPVSARQRQLIQALSDADLATALHQQGLAAVGVGTPLPGVTLTWQFLPGPPRQARPVAITCPHLTPQEKAAVVARVARFGPGRVQVI